MIITSKEEALKNLNLTISEEEYLEKSDIENELASLIYAAYRKGVEEYQKNYWNEKSQRETAEEKFRALAVKMAEQQIANDLTSKVLF